MRCGSMNEPERAWRISSAPEDILKLQHTPVSALSARMEPRSLVMVSLGGTDFDVPRVGGDVAAADA